MNDIIHRLNVSSRAWDFPKKEWFEPDGCEVRDPTVSSCVTSGGSRVRSSNWLV